VSAQELLDVARKEEIPFQALLASLGRSRATAYRALKPIVLIETDSQKCSRAAHPRALSPLEVEEVVKVLNSEKFVDKAPRAIFNVLLDQGVFMCSVRTMYRILEAQGAVAERRQVARSRSFSAPELLATGPNQVWSWDISKLRAASKWTYFYLYVVMDIFSRKIVGWAVYLQEAGMLAEALISKAAREEEIKPGQLTIHSDRGGPMRSKSLAELFSDLSISKSFSRPHVSNDNPFSEAMFKTIKYMPTFPDRFGSVQEARSFMSKFVKWYNEEHRHSGLEYYTPDDVHTGSHVEKKQNRDSVLAEAYLRNPIRFVKGTPSASLAPEAVWINKPKMEEQAMTC
jgi:putative transposase